MISRKQEASIQFTQVIDAMVLGLALYIGYALRAYQIVDFDGLPEIPPLESFTWLFVGVCLFGPLFLEMQGFYQHRLEKSWQRSLRQMTYAGVWLGLLLGLSVIFFRVDIPSRSALLIFLFLGPLGLLLRESVSSAFYLRRLRRGGHGEAIILAGSRESINGWMNRLSPVQKQEINIVETVDFETQSNIQLVEAMHRHSVGRVVLSFSGNHTSQLQQAITACETEGVEAWVSANFINTSIARPTYDSLGTMPMLVFRVTPNMSTALIAKSAIDRVGAIIGLIALTPLFFLIALAVKFTSAGPIIFTQQRAGRHGKPFAMYKFRSMRVGAEAEQHKLLGKNQMNGPVFKVENDPRMTRFGAWLRKTSLDELPQLFNIALGQMSLVGPRPLPVYEVNNFKMTAHRRRLSMKPGLTCLWQISGRSTVTDFDDWVKLDTQYIDNWSLWLDLSILVRTVPVVLFGTGAR